MTSGFTFEDLLNGVKLPERSVSLCLRGDLQAEYEDVVRQLDELSPWASASLSDVNPRVGLEEQRDRLRDEMAAHEQVFRFRAIPQRAYGELHAAHQDKDTGALNPRTWPVALIAACLIAPMTLTEEQVRQLPGHMSDHQFQALYDCALACNREGVTVPFSRRPSAAANNTATS